MPAKSPELHALHGTKPAAKDPTNSQIPAGRPRFTKDLSPEARSIFKTLCRQLQERKALTEGDQSLLILFATIWDRWRVACKHVTEEGAVVTTTAHTKDGHPYEVDKINLHCKLAAESEKQLVKILVQLGLTPQARERVKPTVEVRDPNEIVPGSIADLHAESLEKILMMPARPDAE